MEIKVNSSLPNGLSKHTGSGTIRNRYMVGERGNMKTIGPVYRNEFIERKRQQLERLVSLKGSLTDAEVIALSQELDRYILAVQDSLSEISA